MNTKTPLEILQQISADMEKRGVDFKLITQAIDPPKNYNLTQQERKAYREFLGDDDKVPIADQANGSTTPDDPPGDIDTAVGVDQIPLY